MVWDSMENTCWKITLFLLMDWGQGDRDMAPQHLKTTSAVTKAG